MEFSTVHPEIHRCNTGDTNAAHLFGFNYVG